MKSIFAVLLLLVASGLNAGTFSWRERLQRRPYPSLEIAPIVDYSNLESGIVVRNRGTDALRYGGYAADSPQKYVEAFRDGRWIDDGWDWCGTGMEEYEIPAGASVVFYLKRSPSSEDIRIYTLIRSSDGKRESLVLIADIKAKAAEPGATDNPDDAQRSREDH